MATKINPFRPTRWEHQSDGHPLIWFTPGARLLSQDKSAFVRGSRGTGKTTLLKSICWEDLYQNDSLQGQVNLGDFRHIGIYIKFPDHISSSIGAVNWRALFEKSPDPSLEFFRYFSLVVELKCTERAFEACHELRLAGHLGLAARQETIFVEEFFKEFPGLRSFTDQEPKSLLAASRTMRLILRRMNEASGRGEVGDLIPLLPAREPYELLSYAMEKLSGITRLHTPAGDLSPGFKFCLDDCEVVGPTQQIAINTLVRKSRFPVSWVITSVGSFLETRETFLPQQPLTNADRLLLSLDDRGRAAFKELCQAVVSLRLYFSVPDAERLAVKTPISELFPLTKRLGQQDVNDIMKVIISRSTSPIALQVVEAAESLQAFFERFPETFTDAGRRDGLPLYQAYLLLLWKGKEETFNTSFTQADLNELPSRAYALLQPRVQAWLRRKQVGALLHFAATLGFRRLPLGGSNVIVTLADGSIRDFLEIMGEIYEAYAKKHKIDADSGTELYKFAISHTKIGSAFQTSGIYQASTAFFAGISDRIDIEPSAISRLIEGLGIYTSILQTRPSDPTTLGRAERGVFVFDTRHPDVMARASAVAMEYIRETLRQAELAGYLRPVQVRSKSSPEGWSPDNSPGAGRLLAFRLHRRLAPHFNFSFRGAYEAIEISPLSIAALCGPGARIPPPAMGGIDK